MREPVTSEELSTPRPLGEVRSWVQELCARYHTTGWRNYFLEKRGLSNRLQGELIPLAMLCDHIASDRPRSCLRYFPGTAQSFDAQILSKDGVVQEVLEVTLACDGYGDAIAAEYLGKYGWAPLWSPLAHTGRRGLRTLSPPEMQSLDAEQIVEDGLNLIRRAVEAKSASRKYHDVSLLVGFEDFRFLARHFDWVQTQLKKITSGFQVIYYVGTEGRLFFVQQSEA